MLECFGEFTDWAEFLELHYSLFLLALSFVKIVKIVGIVRTKWTLDIDQVEQKDSFVGKAAQPSLHFEFDFVEGILQSYFVVSSTNFIFSSACSDFS